MNGDELAKMVEAAREYEQQKWWVAGCNVIYDADTKVVAAARGGRASFVTDAPRAIVALAERVAALEAERDALKETGRWYFVSEGKYPELDNPTIPILVAYRTEENQEGQVAETNYDATDELKWGICYMCLEDVEVYAWRYMIDLPPQETPKQPDKCQEGDCPNPAADDKRYCTEHLKAFHRQWAAMATDERLSSAEYQDGIDGLYSPRHKE